jgi:hypothetical protein
MAERMLPAGNWGGKELRADQAAGGSEARVESGSESGVESENPAHASPLLPALV